MNKLKIFKIVITSLNFVLCVIAMVFSILYGTTKIGAYTYAATGCFLVVAVLCVSLFLNPPGILPIEYIFSWYSTESGKKSCPSFACSDIVTLTITTVRKFGKNTFDAHENEEKDKNKEKKD